MGLRDIYNSIGGGVNKVKGSLSGLFSDKISYNRKPVSKPVEPISKNYNLNNRQATINDSDFEALRPLIYGEVSNRNLGKKKLESDVIFNTALNRQREYASRGQNKTISEILAMPNQYQAYGGDQYNEYTNPSNSGSVLKKKEVDSIIDDIKTRVKTGEFKDNTEGAYYYIHNSDGSITYDNLKELFAK